MCTYTLSISGGTVFAATSSPPVTNTQNKTAVGESNPIIKEDTEQYKVTVDADSNVEDVHVEVLPDSNGDYWIPKGYTVTIEDMPDTGYVSRLTNKTYIMDQPRTIDTEAYSPYTITWTSPMSVYGSYINSLSPPSSTTSNYGGKQIRYQKPDGTWAVANPYEAGTIDIKYGSTVYVDMYAGIGSGPTNGVSWSDTSETLNGSGALMSSAKVFTRSAIISTSRDFFSGRQYYGWTVTFSYT